MQQTAALNKKKFDETVDVAIRLGVDPKHADQMVRGAVVLPHGIGKTVRVAVFAKGDKAREATEAGADVVGGEDLAAKVQEGWMEFDVAIATPDMMGVVGRLGKVLGPRGLMPNPKVGTVTPTSPARCASRRPARWSSGRRRRASSTFRWARPLRSEAAPGQRQRHPRHHHAREAGDGEGRLSQGRDDQHHHGPRREAGRRSHHQRAQVAGGSKRERAPPVEAEGADQTSLKGRAGHKRKPLVQTAGGVQSLKGACRDSSWARGSGSTRPFRNRICAGKGGDEHAAQREAGTGRRSQGEDVQGRHRHRGGVQEHRRRSHREAPRRRSARARWTTR